MGWDVFISHASEDKASCVVPLAKALEAVGISSWVDKDQIRLGDSFRSRIEMGLQHCTYGVVILSPRFFTKPWAQAELDAFFNMEMSAANKKLLLPVLLDMTYDQLKAHSPLLSPRKAVRWEDGIEKVVSAIAEIVSGVSLSPPRATVSHPPSFEQHINWASLVFLLMPNGRIAYAESLELDRRADGLDVVLKCNDADDASIIEELAHSNNQPIGIAYKFAGMMGRVTEARLKSVAGVDTGIVKFMIEPKHGNMPEMAYNHLSADQMAEMRVRRILLDEQLPKHGTEGIDIVNRSMLEIFVKGFQASLKVDKSPLPGLYKLSGGNNDLFIAIGRLAAVLQLHLSGAIGQIYRLEFRLEGSTLHVDFFGQRPKQYMNVEPHQIIVKGSLNLA